MAAERVKFYKLLVLDLELGAPALLTFATGVTTITRTIPAGARSVVKLRFGGDARGRYAQVQIVPAGTMRLFGLTLYGRRVGEAAEAVWTWIPGPVEGTPEEWTAHPLPIPPSPEDWTEMALPIPPTSEEWQRIRVPIPESTDLPLWADIPMDR